MNTKQQKLEPKDLQLFKQAGEDYFAGRPPTVQCDVCHAPLRFVRDGTIVRHSCNCGKFDGVLKVF
jgi:hypothetical protein